MSRSKIKHMLDLKRFALVDPSKSIRSLFVVQIEILHDWLCKRAFESPDATLDHIEDEDVEQDFVLVQPRKVSRVK